MSNLDIYNDPILSKRRNGNHDNPYTNITETLQIINGYVVLTEIPNRLNKVKVSGIGRTWYEIDGESKDTLFKVDYPQGVVFFDSIHNGESLTFTYIGEGVHYFPSDRVYYNEEDGEFLTVNDKFQNVDAKILEQKNRVDEQIRSVPQPSEVVDMRIDNNGKIFPVAKDRIDAEQIKIEDAYRDKNGKKYTSLKLRIDGEQSKIEEAYKDKNNKSFFSLKNRIDAEQAKIEEAYKTSDRKQTESSLDDRIIYDYKELKKNTDDKINYLEEKLDQTNVKDFGAKGDGSTDDTQAFLDAQNSIGINKPVYVPSGVYMVDKTDIQGKFYGENAEIIVKERASFGATVPPSEKSATRRIKLSSIPQPILNEFYGKNSGKNIKLEAYTNTGVGEEALRDAETSKQNTAVGYQSQSNQKSQYSNTSIGSGSLQRGTYMNRTTALGNNTLKWLGITDPIKSRHELWFNENDEKNIWNNPNNDHYELLEMNPNVAQIIQPTGYSAPSGAEIVNSNGGFPAPTSSSEVIGNTAVGRNALLQLVKGANNTAMGYQALSRSYTTENCTAIGAFALANNLAGKDNVAIGRNASQHNQTGEKNVTIGNNANGYDVFGHRNVIIGFQASQQTKGDNHTLNTIIGTYTAQNKTNGESNVIIGARAGLNNANGERNVIIGTEAAMEYTGNNSIIIGNKSEPDIQQDRLLWIDYGNDGRETPFIYGDMGNDIINFRANVRPDNDTSQSLGTPSRRWDTLYAQNGTINTSDEREKQQISEIPDEWLDAWENVGYVRFKFNDAVEKKGEEARWHIGVIAQKIEKTFKDKGLDAFEIGLLCYDEWNNADGKGSRYGVRFDECQFMELALMRREMKRLKESMIK